MCKVSIYSCDKGFVLTSSRDISNVREHSLPPRLLNINNIKILSPVDPEGEGSWIGTSSDLATCLLNHSGYNVVSKESRGLLLIKLLSKEYDMSKLGDIARGYSPFVLITVNLHSNFKYQHVWDGESLFSSPISENQKIFLSTTIYSQKEINFYNDSFMSLSNANLSSEKIYSYHLSRSNLYSSKTQKTTSVTQISNMDNVFMKHTDLINNEDYLLRL